MNFIDILAIYGAILSTLVFLWNYRQGKPNIKVELMYGIETKNKTSKSGVYILIRNRSQHTITLKSISLLYQYKKSSILDKIYFLLKYQRFPSNINWVHSSLSNYNIDDKCPIILLPWKSHDVFIKIETINDIVKNKNHILKAVVQDDLGDNVYSYVFKTIY